MISALWAAPARQPGHRSVTFSVGDLRIFGSRSGQHRRYRRPEAEITRAGGHMKESSDFSLVSGGPLYQLWRRTHLSGNALELMHQRVLVAVLLTWVPLLLLSIVAGNAWQRSGTLTVLQGIEKQTRPLISVPLFIVGAV